MLCGIPVGTIGPLEAKLKTYEPVRGLVFGAFGEASPTVHQLIKVITQMGAEKHWRDMGALNVTQAAGCLTYMHQKKWGIMAMRGAARLKIDRLEFVGGRQGADASNRRTDARATHAARMRAMAWSATRGGPTVWGGRRA